jgi:predicted GH43/DUF377 family glycosyl hydrolase
MMKRSKGLGATITTALSIVLAMLLMTGQALPAQAAGPPWTRYSGQVTLENERYVTDAWVLREGDTYRMWYTHVKTDRNVVEMLDEMSALHLDDIIYDLANLDLDALLNDLAALKDTYDNVDDIIDFLDSIKTVIGYATSGNGINWTIEEAEALAGDSNDLWNNVGTPCVINDNGTYKMWYTRDRIDLTTTQLENILSQLNEGVTARKDAVAELLSHISTVIAYAESPDGENWVVVDDEVVAGSGYALESVGDPCVIKDEGTYKMWHTQRKTDLTEQDLASRLANLDSLDSDSLVDILDGTASVISYTTSSDGINWAAPIEVLSSGSAAWDSIASPSVVKVDDDYQVWYTRIETDRIPTALQDILDEIQGLGVPALLQSIDPQDLDEFLSDLATLDLTNLKELLSDTSTVIGYAESADGENWVVDDPQDITGDSTSLWSGVKAPCVIQYGSSYKMWYTKGIDDLSVEELLDLLQGTVLPIGYAYYIPRSGGGPSAGEAEEGGLTLEVIVDFSSGYYSISEEGRIQETVDITSEDELLNIVIYQGTFALDEEGNPTTRLEFTVAETPPPPPPEAYIIGLPYIFKPSGVIFDPPITVNWSYDPTDIPAGIAERDLVIAYYSEALGKWVVLPSVVDIANNIVIASASHFTTFAILAYSGTPPPPPTPAAFAIGSLSVSPVIVNTGQPVTISVVVTNIGEEAGIYTVTLKIDGAVEATERITLTSGDSKTVTFTTRQYQAGSYSVDVNSLTGLFTVEVAPSPPTTPPLTPAKPSWWLVGSIIAAVVMAVTIPLVLRRRRSHYQ